MARSAIIFQQPLLHMQIWMNNHDDVGDSGWDNGRMSCHLGHHERYISTLTVTSSLCSLTVMGTRMLPRVTGTPRCVTKILGYSAQSSSWYKDFCDWKFHPLKYIGKDEHLSGVIRGSRNIFVLNQNLELFQVSALHCFNILLYKKVFLHIWMNMM